MTIYTKSGQLHKDIANAIVNSRIEGNKIYPVHYSGRGNYITKKDYTQRIIEVLDFFCYKYTQGNDAPRGGQNGNFIEVSNTAIRKIKSL